jgi:CheY-like chemotaxis protein
MTGKPVTLLIVEDDEFDAMAIMRALESLKISNPTLIAQDGIEALEHLRGENGREKITVPYIILLDINMPRMSGLELLDIVRGDPELKQAIVFIFTTSSADQDIIAAYEYNVAGYVFKSDIKESLKEAIQQLNFHWTLTESSGA